MGHPLTETVAAIVAAHRAGTMTPAQTVARSYQRIRDYNDPAVFISLRDEKAAIAEAEALSTKDASDAAVARRARWRSRTISTHWACRPRRPARPFLIRRRRIRRRWRNCAPPALSSSARPTSISSPPASSVSARPTAFPVNPIRADLVPGGSSSGSGVSPYRPDWCRWRSAPTRQAAVAYRRCSTTSSD